MNFVYGLSKSGISVVKYFIKNQIEFDVWDDDELIRKKFKKNYKIIRNIYPSKINLKNYERIIVSPGISIRQKKFYIHNHNERIQRDLNVYLENIKKEKLIAITGTNGKSTTTKLVGNILKKNNFKTFVGGNIGNSLCNYNFAKRIYSHHVIELSSFQLETARNFNPKISILLNLSKDHMDRYKNLKDYFSQKKKIITNNKYGYNLISFDDIYCQKICKNKKINNQITFSINNSKADIFIKNNYIYDNYFFKNKKTLINKISNDLSGNFNLQNILVAYICSKIFNISNIVFQKTISNFRGLPYRFKTIYDSKKLKIINNSKATNVESTINCLLGFDNVYLIMGGLAKEKSFKKFIKYKNNISRIFIYGHSASLIYNQVKNYFYAEKYTNLSQIISSVFKIITKYNEKKKIILLFAPSCASFDQYNNFEVRGMHFDNLINKKITSL